MTKFVQDLTEKDFGIIELPSEFGRNSPGHSLGLLPMHCHNYVSKTVYVLSGRTLPAFGVVIIGMRPNFVENRSYEASCYIKSGVKTRTAIQTRA